MSKSVKVQVQDQFGRWHNYSSVPMDASAIRRSLRAALITQLGQHSGKARAIDADTGQLIDVQFASRMHN